MGKTIEVTLTDRFIRAIKPPEIDRDTYKDKQVAAHCEKEVAERALE